MDVLQHKYDYIECVCHSDIAYSEISRTLDHYDGVRCNHLEVGLDHQRMCGQVVNRHAWRQILACEGRLQTKKALIYVLEVNFSHLNIRQMDYELLLWEDVLALWGSPDQVCTVK